MPEGESVLFYLTDKGVVDKTSRGTGENQG
jgi:hypothetical protein